MIGTPISKLSHGFGRACHAASASAPTQEGVIIECGAVVPLDWLLRAE
jgi:hypothetical protein